MKYRWNIEEEKMKLKWNSDQIKENDKTKT